MADKTDRLASLELEEALLGLMIQNDSCITTVKEEGLTVDDFYYENNKIVFQNIMELRNLDQAVNMASLSDRLNDKGDLKKIGGFAALQNMVNMAGSKSKCMQYIDGIANKSQLRKLLEAVMDIQKEIYDKAYYPELVFDKAKDSITNLVQSRAHSSFKSSREKTEELLEIIKNAKEKKKGVNSGIGYLDYKTNGFQKGDLIILAARTSVGKTAFAVAVARYAAIRQKKSVAFFSLEMPWDQILRRMLAVEGGISQEHLRNGNLTEEEENSLISAARHLQDSDIYVEDSSSIKINEIAAKCRKLKNELEAKDKTLDLIVVDYLQLVQASRGTDSRQQEVAEISRNLKQLAREMDCPVIALSQLSRETEKRGAPILADLRESGAIEQDADIVLFLSNVQQEKGDSNLPLTNPRDVYLSIAKHRNGSLGKVMMSFNAETGSYIAKENREDE